MKKVIISVCFATILGCSKNSAVEDLSNTSCETAAAAYEKAFTDWTQDITNKAKCEAVKKSLNNIVKTCSVYTVAQRKVYEDQIKQITCD